MFWFAGVVYALAGTHVYIEYGINIPRRRFEGVEQGIPRSGGELNYVSSFLFEPLKFESMSAKFSDAGKLRFFSAPHLSKKKASIRL